MSGTGPEGVTGATPTDHADPHSSEVVAVASARALGSRPVLRSVANVGWSAFLGASLSLVTVLLVPEDWLDPPVDFGRLSLLFLGLWTLALVPALSAVLLSHGTGSHNNAR